MQVGRVEIGDFRQIAGYISKTVGAYNFQLKVEYIGSRMRSIE